LFFVFSGASSGLRGDRLCGGFGRLRGDSLGGIAVTAFDLIRHDPVLSVVSLRSVVKLGRFAMIGLG
jgi:hypothetical protein